MEKWKPVVGWSGLYEVSDRGRIRSLHKIGRPAKGGILSQTRNAKGYCRIRLSGHNRDRTYVVHRLVLEAFVGPRPDGHECNHKDGDKANNNVDNLEWVTPKENNAHAVKIGLWSPHRGVDHGRAKLNESDVYEIRSLEGKTTQRKLAERFGVRQQTIASIWKRRLWKHLE